MILDKGYSEETVSEFSKELEGGSSSSAPTVKPVTAGSRIGSSKEGSLFEKISSTSLRSVDYGDIKPLVTKKLPEAKGSSKNSWFDLEVKYPVKARIDDIERVSKLLLKLQGIKWEGHTAALQTLQNNLEAQRIDPTRSTEAARSENNSSDFWSNLGNKALTTLKNAGLALVSGIGLTASTLAQVAVAGTGEHQEPFLESSYLQTGVKTEYSKYGTQILNSLVSSLGILGSNTRNVSGASAALAGVPVDGNPKYGFIEGYRRVGNSKYSRTRDFEKGDPTNPANIQDIRRPSRDQDRQYSYSPGGYNTSESSLYSTESENLYGPTTPVARKTETLPEYTEGSVSYLGAHSWSVQSRYSAEETYMPAEQAPFDEDNARHEILRNKAAEISYPSKTGSITHSRHPSPTGKSYLPDNDSPFAEKDTEHETHFKRLVESASDTGSASTLRRNVNKPTFADGTSSVSRSVDEIRTKDYRYSGPINRVISGTDKKYLDLTSGSLGKEESNSGLENFNKNFNLIPFEIQSNTSTKRYFLHFQANLDSYDDSFSADWSATSYVGRADKFYTYGGFTRDINFGFKVVALRPEHLKPIYEQLNYLAGTTAPTYRDGVFMNGTIGRVTIGDLLYAQYGMFKSVKLSWEVDVPWEISDSGNTIRVPHMLNVSIGFTPIHIFNPTSETDSFFAKPRKL